MCIWNMAFFISTIFVIIDLVCVNITLVTKTIIIIIIIIDESARWL